MSYQEKLGALVQSIPFPRQQNDPDITVVRLDIHTNGFVVRCEIGGSSGLRPGGPVALDLHDSLNTRYERADVGEDFISYTPAIPENAMWLKVLTRPETHVDLGEPH